MPQDVLGGILTPSLTSKRRSRQAVHAMPANLPSPHSQNTQKRTTRTWTREQALAFGALGRQRQLENAAKRAELSALAKSLRRSHDFPHTLQVILAKCYVELAALRKCSPAAERLSRTIFNLEQIRRIHTKGTKADSAPPAVAQSGPLGIAEQEPAADPPSPVPDATPDPVPDSSLPEMSPDV